MTLIPATQHFYSIQRRYLLCQCEQVSFTYPKLLPNRMYVTTADSPCFVVCMTAPFVCCKVAFVHCWIGALGTMVKPPPLFMQFKVLRHAARICWLERAYRTLVRLLSSMTSQVDSIVVRSHNLLKNFYDRSYDCCQYWYPRTLTSNQKEILTFLQYKCVGVFYILTRAD